MARQPDDDERLLVPKCPDAKGERVYLMELARYLHHSLPKVRKRAKYLGIMYRATRIGSTNGVAYVTVEGAMRLIAHFRAEQGKVYMRGQDFHARAERIARTMAKSRAKKRAEQAALNARAHLCIGFSASAPPGASGSGGLNGAALAGSADGSGATTEGDRAALPTRPGP